MLKFDRHFQSLTIFFFQNLVQRKYTTCPYSDFPRARMEFAFKLEVVSHSHENIFFYDFNIFHNAAISQIKL